MATSRIKQQRLSMKEVSNSCSRPHLSRTPSNEVRCTLSLFPGFLRLGPCLGREVSPRGKSCSSTSWLQHVRPGDLPSGSPYLRCFFDSTSIAFNGSGCPAGTTSYTLNRTRESFCLTTCLTHAFHPIRRPHRYHGQLLWVLCRGRARDSYQPES
jgi:hypothetical protein